MRHVGEELSQEERNKVLEEFTEMMYKSGYNTEQIRTIPIR